MLKKIWNIFCWSMGISTDEDRARTLKWMDESEQEGGQPRRDDAPRRAEPADSADAEMRDEAKRAS